MLKTSRRTTRDELKDITNFFDDVKSIEDSINGLNSILQLGQLATLLSSFVNVLKQYEFACAGSDATEDDQCRLEDLEDFHDRLASNNID
eukprot:591590-Prymnesium_polylepis.1